MKYKEELENLFERINEFNKLNNIDIEVPIKKKQVKSVPSPANNGYYQIGDAFFRKLVSILGE